MQDYSGAPTQLNIDDQEATRKLLEKGVSALFVVAESAPPIPNL
jgi:hypothetical protein